MSSSGNDGSSIGNGSVGKGGRAIEGEAEVSESNGGSRSVVRARQAMLYSKRGNHSTGAGGLLKCICYDMAVI